MTTHPEVLWAQRSSESDEAKNVVYLTVNLPDIQESTLKYELTPSSISFSATAGNAAKGLEERNYAFKFDLFEEIDPDTSAKKLTSRSFNLILRKKAKKLEYWTRLTKEKIKTPFIKTDFSKWVDEDEQDGIAAEVEDDFDVGGMGGMGGMPPGMGGGMPGGMDFEAMMKSMGGAASAGSGSAEDAEEEDSDDDGPPPLEDAEPSK